MAELFPEFGSVTPLGGATVAVFDRVPVAVALTVPVTVKVTVPLTGTSMVKAVMSPLAVAGQFGASHVHFTPVSAFGIVSVTFAAFTADGPEFLTVRV